MITFLFSALQAAEQMPTEKSPIVGSNILNMVGQFLPFVLIVGILYFFIIRPQNQQRKALALMISNLKVGDKVVTRGGLIAIITQVRENTFIIKLNDGATVEILKDAIISVFNGENN